MFTAAGWWEQFSANLLADAIVALAFGLGLARYLGRQQKAREEQKELTRALELLKEELSFNCDQAKLANKELGQGHLLFPLFNTSTGDVLLNNPQLVTGAQVDLMSHIANTYNRLHSANELYSLLFDPMVSAGRTTWLSNYDWLAQKVIERCSEAVPWLQDSLKMCDTAIGTEE